MYAMILLSASPSRLFIDLSKLDIRKSIHGLVAGGGGGLYHFRVLCNGCAEFDIYVDFIFFSIKKSQCKLILQQILNQICIISIATVNIENP